MSEEASPQVDPFSPAVLDEATELRALSRALELGKGFKLIFARCNQADQRRSLVQKLCAELPSLNIQEIQLTEPATHLLDALRKTIQQPVPDALFVYGLEYSFPSAAEAHRTPLVANLNASRNSFPNAISCPLVLWIPEFVLNAIMLGAPDFFSIRSGVYYFAADPGETVELAGNLTVGGEWMLYNLSPKEKEERIRAIKGLLEDYEALPAERRDENTEIRLRLRLGNLFFLLDTYDSATRYYQDVLGQAQTLHDAWFEAAAHSGLGLIHLRNGEYSQAETFFQRALEISRKAQARLTEARALSNLGTLYHQLENWDKAHAVHLQSLDILREVGDRAEEGVTLFNLGNTSFRQNKFSEAEEYLRRSLEIAHEVGDIDGERGALSTLGQTYVQQGRLLEAENAYERSLELARQLGDRSAEGRTLYNLSLSSEQQGDISAALDFQKRAVETLRETKAPELDAARQRLANLERKT